ncbi:MAG: cytochrome c [Hyphomicrobium sp.]|jgi:cytochrome c5
MSTRIVSLKGIIIVAALVPLLAGAAAVPFELKSVTVELPDSTRMFEGAGADAANNNCLACHSASMVLAQPPLSKAVWEKVVHKMIDTYKAPVAPEDVAAIVDYLAAGPR